MKGRVVRLVTDRGFGFIREEGGHREYFFHSSGCLPDCQYSELSVGDLVTFEPTEGPKGPKAEDVTYA